MGNDKNGWTRRQFVLSLGAAAIAAGCESKRRASEARRFPSTFRWGCGSSAFQVEGALDVDGRGESIWDVFAKQNGRIKDGSTPSITCNSYYRYKEDAALISAANLNSYKFSISWPRLFPTGSGSLNERGMDYYDRLTDALLQRHITPYVTLFHWDLPQRLYELGGWTSRDTAERFADYAAAVTHRLGDRLKNFITLNEPNVHLLLGHVTGSHAPGLHDAKLIGPVTHHLNMAHGRAIQAMRAQRNDLTIGAGLALAPVRPEGGKIHLLNDIAALAFDEIWSGAFLDPLLKGKYPLAVHQMLADVVKTGDMSTVHQGCDFIGVNYYSPAYLKADFSSPSFLNSGRTPAGVTQDASGREIDPSGLQEVLNRLTKDYGNPRLIVTENGCSDPLGDHAAIINDEFRIHYLSAHLRAVMQAMDNGSRVEGFFVWSLLDNWEWESGFTSKFGLVAHNVNTGERTQKKSYAWFADIAETGLLPAYEVVQIKEVIVPTALITGGHAGIGFECAKQLASRSRYNLVLAGRSMEQINAAAQQLRTDYGIRVSTLKLDTSSLSSVRDAATKFRAMLDSGEVDSFQALLCNAGGYFRGPLSYSEDGYETTFATNCLGHFVLIELLTERIGDNGRIVFTASGTHDPDTADGKMVGIVAEPDAIALANDGKDGKRPLSAGKRYSTSKLCMILYAYELHRRLRRAGSSIASIAFDPGAVPQTGLLRTMPKPVQWLAKTRFMKWITKRVGVTQGSISFSGASLAKVATDPAYRNASGKYFQSNNGALSDTRSSKLSYDEQRALKLWNDSKTLARLQPNEESVQLQ